MIDDSAYKYTLADGFITFFTKSKGALWVVQSGNIHIGNLWLLDKIYAMKFIQMKVKTLEPHIFKINLKIDVTKME